MEKLLCAILGKDFCPHQLDQSENSCKACPHLIRVSPETPECPTAKIIEDLSPILEQEFLEIVQKADRFNEGKPKWSLVHYESLVPMIRVLEFGATKYAPFNWQKPMNTTEILESMQRHLAALFDGEIYDKESGVSHMGHIQCNAMFYNFHIERERKLKENNVL